MKNAIFFFRNIGNPHGAEWRKIGCFNIWAFSDWAHYAGFGLHWSTYDRCLVLHICTKRKSWKTITLLRLAKEGTSA